MRNSNSAKCHRGTATWQSGAIGTAILFSVLAGCAPEAAVEAVATVNRQAVSVELLAALASERLDRTLDQLNIAERQSLTQELVELVLAGEVAREKGWLKDPLVRAELKVTELQALRARLVRVELRQAMPDDVSLHAEFLQNLSRDSSEFDILHVLVPTSDAAQVVIYRLQAGEPFDAVARAVSQDDSANTDGHLGWRRLGQLPKGIAEVVKTMTVGQIYDKPVQSPYGWHVLQVAGIRPVAAPKYEEMRPQLVAQHMQRQEAEYFAKLRKDADIEVK